LHVEIDNQEEVCESQDDDQDHEHESEAVGNCLLDQLDVICCGLEEPHPVKHFAPHKEAAEGANSS
jgi:hypothetical protein